MTRVLTIGHSVHASGTFLSLLKASGVETLVDVRTTPSSRWQPQYNRSELADTLEASGIAYMFAGDTLGGRPASTDLYDGNVADYLAMAKTRPFTEAISEVAGMAAKGRVCLMCSEHDPAECHRALLAGRHLGASGLQVDHILRDGSIETGKAFEERLIAMAGVSVDMFTTRKQALKDAYLSIGKRMAYRRT